MRTIVLTLLLLVFLVAFSSKSFAQQSCTGSLGDPVINEDFGSGQNPGPPLPPGVTNMTYTSSNCPGDGYYTIANSVDVSCFGASWHNLTSDRAHNPNGYMMIINASYQPSVFFTQAANGLCPNTTYEFAAWIVNLNLPNFCSGNPIKPNISFSIETSDGTPLQPQPYNTGDIPASSDIEWKRYSTFFTTPANTTSVVVKMFNNGTGGCGNDLALDDITFRACGPVINIGFEHTTGTANSTSICEGSSGTIVLRADAGNVAYQWQVDTPTGWMDIPGETSSAYDKKFTNATVGTYTYRVGIGNGSAISVVSCRVYSTPLTIVVNPLPTVPPIADQSVCEGGPLTLTATGATSYIWRGPGMTPTTTNPLVIPSVGYNNAGTYEVVGIGSDGCSTAEIPVKVTILPRPVATAQSNVSAVCEGESAQLTATGGSFYTWSPATGLSNASIPNPVATPLQTTTYTAHVSNGSCVDSSKSVTITVYNNPIANAGNPIELFEGQSAKLNGTVTGDNIVSYSWSPTTFLSDPTSLTPITTPTDNITYTLTVQSKTCGQSSSSVYVRVFKKITIPNTFSPNNDGVNDLWNIDALVTYPECSVSVFDRYGQQVYQSTGYSKSWDGTQDGRSLPEGTYYYVIDLKNGTPKLSGWVLIVR